jgi:dodecin
MSNVYKMTEIVGCSSKSFGDAVEEAIKRAAQTLRHLGWFEVTEQRGLIKDGKVAEFQVTIKVGFRLDETP